MSSKPLKIWTLSTRDKTPFDQMGIGEDLSVRPLDFDQYQSKLEEVADDPESQPDLLEIGTTWTAYIALQQTGIQLVDLTKFASEVHAATIFFPSARQTCVIQDEQGRDQYCAFPFTIDLRILFYNAQMLSQIEPNPAEAFTNLEEFVQKLQEWKAKASINPIAFPHHEIFQDVLPWIWARGGKVVTSDRRCLLNAGKTRQAILDYMQLATSKCAPSLCDAPKTLGELARGLLERKYLVVASGLWLLGIQQSSPQYTNLDVQAFALPPGALRASFVGGTNLAVVQKPNDTPETLQRKVNLLKALTINSFYQKKYATLVGTIPANMRAWREMRRGMVESPQDFEKVIGRRAFSLQIVEAIEDALITERQLPSLPELPQIESKLNRCFRSMFEEIGRCSLPDAETVERIVRDGIKSTHREITLLLSGGVEYFTTPESRTAEIDPIYNLIVYEDDKSVSIVDQNKRVKLSDKPFQILKFLLNHYPQPCFDKDIYTYVWPKQDTSSSLNCLTELERLHNTADQDLLKLLQMEKYPYLTSCFERHLTSGFDLKRINLARTADRTAFHNARAKTRRELIQTIREYLEGKRIGKVESRRIIAHISILRTALGTDIIPWGSDHKYQLKDGLLIAVITPPK